MTKITSEKSEVKEKKPASKLELGMLEEDDEFEEFAAQDVSNIPQSTDDVTVWEDNWDDDIVDDEFTHQLRGEFMKQGKELVVPVISPGDDDE